MYRCKPSKWILPAIAGVGLPLLAGWVMSDKITGAFSSSCNAALEAAAQNSWAKCDTTGFSAKVSGEAPDEDSIGKAVSAVQALPGVRGVEKVATVAPPPPAPVMEPPPADLNPSMDAIFKGKWPSAAATALAIGVGGTTYVLGKNPELTATGDDWSLNLGKTLSPGNYELTPQVTDKFNRVNTYPTIKFTVNNPPPPPEPEPVVEPPKVEESVAIEVPPSLPEAAAPTVDHQTSNQPISMVSGTWDSTNASRLRVSIPVRGINLRKGDKGLTVDGNKWSVALAEPLGPGSYEVIATSTDEEFRSKSDATTSDLIVEPPPPKPADAIVASAMTAPTVTAASKESNLSVVSGTWDSANAKRLRLSIPSKNFSVKLGGNGLATDGNNWTWNLPDTLTEGTYDVIATSSDADYRPMSDATKDEIVVTAAAAAAPAPEAAAPTINSATAMQALSVVSGTWDSANSKRLRVGIPARGLFLKQGDPALKISGNNWSVDLAEPLGPGSYEAIVTSSDEGFRPKTSKAMLIVDAAPKAADKIVMVDAAAPTVNSMKSKVPAAYISGRYDSKNAKRLRLAIAGTNQSTRLGSPNLMTVGDNWVWKLDTPLTEGTYEVVATSSDADYRAKSDSTASEVVVMAPPPPPAPEPAPAPAKVVSNVKIPDARPIDCAAVLGRVNKAMPIRFVVNKTELGERATLAIKQYAALLKDARCAALKVSLKGFADERGTVKYNQMLSDGRARSVANALVAEGVDAGRFSQAGFNETNPVDPGNSEDAWAKNRRVEVTVQ